MAGRIVDALAHPSQRNKVDGRRSDDTTTRWLVQKRTYFKGNYDRVLTVADTSISTQMPNLQVTNVYSLAPDFSVKSLAIEKDCLVLQARPNGKVRSRDVLSRVHIARLACSWQQTDCALQALRSSHM